MEQFTLLNRQISKAEDNQIASGICKKCDEANFTSLADKIEKVDYNFFNDERKKL